MTDSLPSSDSRDRVDPAPDWVLGIDAATPPSSVALARGEEVVGWRTGPFGPRTDAWILGAIDALLTDVAIPLSDVAVIAAGVGPGTFTGIRVAIATAQGLARGSGARAVGVSTLEGLACCADVSSGTTLLPLIDARRGQLYAARYATGDTLATLEDPHVTSADRVVASHAELGAPLLLGTGVATDARLEELPRATARPWPVGAGVALRAMQRLRAGDELAAPLPVYLRAPDAKIGRNPLQRN
jgi:tRNA threonylcarbamoyl adenosine modification protein YeaZ